MTSKGKRIATSTIRKHRLWEVFLVEKLQFKWDAVHQWSNIESIEPDLFIKRTKGCLAVKKLSKKLPLSEFSKLKFLKMSGENLPSIDLNSYLIRMGRVKSDYRYFIVYDNYLNILSYNCSNYYGLSVGLLSDKFK